MEIRKAQVADCKELSEVAIASFLPAHGHSSPKEDMDNYIQNNFSEGNLRKEIADSANEYQVLIYENNIVGYFKINPNLTTSFSEMTAITYMSRLYVLQEYYNFGFGKKLLQKAIEVSKIRGQEGMWLKVWVENQRAINFYKKMGFEIIGTSDFVISETHSNPNFVMLKKY
ncbi:MAG: GNAT family N-acetyltransferase [Flavobacteriaceae bacterium]|nr:GNAT family N-acetyltransferase [Flavobacteriaceae bacterium]